MNPMKKLFLTLLCLLLACSFSSAFATSEVDRYLTDRIWELEVDIFGTSRYIFFAHNGYGYLADHSQNSAGEMFYFSWYSYDEMGTAYIRIDFKEDRTPLNGWGSKYTPCRNAAYSLIWSSDSMMMSDTINKNTNGSPKMLTLRRAQLPTPEHLEQIFADINAQFQ
jgi:hypothetical protein